MITDFIPPVIIVLAIIGLIIIIIRKSPQIKKDLKESNDLEKSVVEKKKDAERIKMGVWSRVVLVTKAIYAFFLGIFKGIRASFFIIKREIAKRVIAYEKKKRIESAKTEEIPFSVAQKEATLEYKKNDTVEEQLNEARRLKGEGQVKEAEKMYIDIIVKNPKNFKPYEELGRIYFDNKNYKDAAAAFNEALKLDTTNSKNIESLSAKSYFELGAFKKAFEHAEKAVKLDPKDSELLVMIARIYRRNKNDTQERIAWEKVIAVNPNDEEAKKRIEALQS